MTGARNISALERPWVPQEHLVPSSEHLPCPECLYLGGIHVPRQLMPRIGSSQCHSAVCLPAFLFRYSDIRILMTKPGYFS